MLDIAFHGEGPAAGASGHAYIWFEADAGAVTSRCARAKVEWRAEEPGAGPPEWLRDALGACLREAFLPDAAASR
jgi:hypothetical protein